MLCCAEAEIQLGLSVCMCTLYAQSVLLASSISAGDCCCNTLLHMQERDPGGQTWAQDYYLPAGADKCASAATVRLLMREPLSCHGGHYLSHGICTLLPALYPCGPCGLILFTRHFLVVLK